MITKRRLRKYILLAVPALLAVQVSFGQDLGTIFNHSGERITWMGLDFTQVKLKGSMGTVSKEELVPLFDDINRLIINERSKYNFAAALRKDQVPFDLDVATKLNSEIDPGKTITYTSYDDKERLNEEIISVLVKQYSSEKAEGIGLVFFMETLDKEREKGTMWVTFFSLPDRNLLLTERMTGEAGGISFRNHWARTVHDVITQIREIKYARWKYASAK